MDLLNNAIIGAILGSAGTFFTMNYFEKQHYLLKQHAIKLIVSEETENQLSNLKNCFEDLSVDKIHIDKLLWQENKILLAKYLPNIYSSYANWIRTLITLSKNPNMSNVIIAIEAGEKLSQQLKPPHQ